MPSAFAALALPLPVSAQQYPAGPVRILIGFAAGSGPDLQARTIAQQLATDLKQSFFIENRLGANGTIAARAVATAPPDGLTLLFSSSSIAPTPHIYKSLGYDTLTDLRAVATSGVLDGMLMLVDAKTPIDSVPEFIAFAKANRVLYGSPGVGNVLHLAAEAFAQKAGATLQHVPYKGSSEVMTALLGGSVQVMFVTPVSVVGLVKAQRQYYVSTTYNAEQAVVGFLPVQEGTVVAYINHTFTDQVAGFGGSVKRGVGRKMMASKLKESFDKTRQKVAQ